MRIFTFLLKNANPKIEYYSRFSPSPLSIKQFLDFGKSPVILKEKCQNRIALFTSPAPRQGQNPVDFLSEMSQFSSSVLVINVLYKLLWKISHRYC